MKKLFFIVALATTAFTQNIFAQEKTITPTTHLLYSYYNIKNALVAGNAKNASESAEAFVKTLQAINEKTINETSRAALLKDAGKIAGSKDLKQQREQFSSFSTNMAALAKMVKLDDEPVYLQYCPMKKVSWLSSEKAIKNPYYGNSMLSCGKVQETKQ